jgi:hypothetical protein
VDSRTGLEEVERRKILPLPGFELRPLGRPARSQSLYRLHYPDSLIGIILKYKAKRKEVIYGETLKVTVECMPNFVVNVERRAAYYESG